ncbi:MAG: hypothetical protein JW818_09765 [Pirellulales bacterium]|nr:hypothetical protein [Pirellulales bacterium]
MFRILLCAMVVVVAGLFFVGQIPAQEKANDHEVVWIGVTLSSPDGEDNEYLIGTIDKKIFDEIELGQYDRKFLRLSNLRIEKDAPEGESSDHRVFLDCADVYDWGVILVRYDHIVSIELKKRDPLTVE